jgi:hypothetical protein
MFCISKEIHPYLFWKMSFSSSYKNAVAKFHEPYEKNDLSWMIRDLRSIAEHQPPDDRKPHRESEDAQ